MHKRCILYKGCYISPGTNLHAELEKRPRDEKLIEKMYKVVDVQFKRDWPETTDGIESSTGQTVFTRERIPPVENAGGNSLHGSEGTGGLEES